MAEGSDIQGEELYRVQIGQGMYTSELSSNIADGFSPICYNLVATGDSLENRIGIKQPTVDYKVMEAIIKNDPANVSPDDYYIFNTLSPFSNDSTQVAFAWGGRGNAVPGGTLNNPTLNLVRAAGTTDANDGFMSVNLPVVLTGICQYADAIYFTMGTGSGANSGVQKISAINWATDAVTYSQLASTPSGQIRGLFAFKDRIWGFGFTTSKHVLFFTNLPTVGGLPETWAFATNRIPIVGPNGSGSIKKIVPLGNRLAIFTTNGLFTLLVEGEPASWILRVLDSKSISTHSQCAFESKGIIYYVNTEGVWATNTLSVSKVSLTIDDQFWLSKGSRIHTIAPYEDGMIVSVAKHNQAVTHFDAPNSRVFYSKLDPIAWTEWNFNRHGLGDFTENLVAILSTTPKLQTYLNAEPVVYMLGVISDSAEGANQNSVVELFVFDGGSDTYRDRSNTQRTQPVGIYLKTKAVDGGNPFREKRNKQSYIEIFTSDAEHLFQTSWDMDLTVDEGSEIVPILLNDFTIGLGSNLVRIKSSFYYRRCALNLRAELQTDNSQIKIKDLVLIQDTRAKPREQIS